MQRTLPAILVTAAAVFPLGQTWAASHPSSRAGAAPHKQAAPPHKTKPKAKVSTHKYTGPVEDMQWGPVQVTIVVTGKKITDVQASAPMERARSQFINSQAIPWLRQEVLKAQSATIDAIGGATLTSEAFYYSLQGALQTAHKAHTL